MKDNSPPEKKKEGTFPGDEFHRHKQFYSRNKYTSGMKMPVHKA